MRGALDANAELLPDGRVKNKKPKWVRIGNEMVWCEPTYCLNCGKLGPYVPVDSCNFAFYLCNPCAEVYGDVPGYAFMPDEIFYANLAAQMLESFGRYLTEEELSQVVRTDERHPLTLLVRDHNKASGHSGR